MNTPKSAAAAVALAALASLAACGSATTAGDAPSLAVSLPAAPAAGTILTAAQTMRILEATSANLTTVHESLSINTSLAPLTGEGDLARDGSGLKVHMTLAVPSIGPVEVTSIGSGFYIKNLPRTGGKWIKLDLNDTKNMTAQTFGAMTAISPAQMFSQYAGGVTGATAIGSDATGDHYQVIVNSAQARTHLPRALAGNPAITQGMKGLPGTVKLNVWIKAGLLQQTVLDLGSAGSVTAKFSNYGQPVVIQAPVAADMTSAPGLG